MKKILPILFLMFTLVLSADEKVKTYWLDVRTTEEFNSGHIKGAIHIPYQKIGKEIEKITKDKNADIKVYCKVGGRAGVAKKTLEKMGYKKVTNAGGYKQILKEQKNK